MILIDFSMVMIAALTYNITRLNKVDLKLARQIALSTIKKHNRKFRVPYGKTVICCDSPQRGSWRREIFPQYKAHRVVKREQTQFNWPEIFEWLQVIREEMDTSMPYPVIAMNRAEADDVIATLAKLSSQNHEQTVIISNDRDFHQLHNQYVCQHDPNSGYTVVLGADITYDRKAALKEKIIRGDAGDGIPNILSGDHFLVEKIKQSSITQKRLDEMMALDLNKTEHQRNWIRNKSLIDFDEIPSEICRGILDIYNEKKDKRVSPFGYVSRHGTRELIEALDHF